MRDALVRPAAAGRARLSLAARAPARRPVALLVGAGAAVCALAPIAVYVWIAAHRLAFPYELDWLEGGQVEIVNRVLEGRPLYTAPTLAYVSYTYPPLYAWASAAVAEVTGIGFLPLRLVSFLSSLVCFVALWRWTVRATGDRLAGAVASGLFAATYVLTGWSLDIGRLDTMFVALTLLALWTGRDARTLRAGVAVGVIAFLAFFTKQIALLTVVAPLAWLAFRRPRAGGSALAVLVILAAVSTVVLDATSDGWYRYFVVSELGDQPWVSANVLGFWRVDLLRHLRPLALLLAAGLVVTGVAAWRRRRASAAATGSDQAGSAEAGSTGPGSAPELGVAYELLAAAGLLATAYLSRLHSGGWSNTLIPAYAACALLGAVAFARLRRLGRTAAVLALAIVLVQIWQLLALPQHAIPARGQRAAGAELMSRLRSLPGPVLVLAHPWYGTHVGQGAFAQTDAIYEVLRSHAARGRDELRRALAGALNREGINAVVLDGPPATWLAPQLRRDFVRLRGPVTAHPLVPPADLHTTPRLIYVRRTRSP